jgi:hypothetical protein
MDGGRTERDVGAVVTGRAGTFDEESHPERILGRALAGDARAFDPGCDVDTDRRDGTKRARDVGRVEAAGQGDRHVPGDRGGQALRCTCPVPPGCGPPAVSRRSRSTPPAR